MRIATNTASEAMLARIQKLSARQSTLQTQVATGQKIFQPEDDPAGVGRVLNWNTERSRLQQFQRNAERALDLSQATYAGLQEMKKISDRAGELVPLGAGSSSPDSFRAYAKEVNQLIEQAVQLGTTQFRNDYLFSGTELDSAPFAVTRVSGEVTGVTYDGDAGSVSIQLSENSSIAPGSTTATNNGLVSFINNLVALRDALESGDGSNVSGTQAGLAASEDLLVDALSEQGAVQLRIEVSQRQQEARIQNIDTLISNTADVDISRAVVDLSQASTAYQAALASGTKILQLSILDYLS